MRTPFTGVGTALVTPFAKSGALDEAIVRRLARRQIDAGIHFLVPCGTTGENPTLSHAERMRIVEIVVDEAKGRIPILAGAGGYDTKEVIHAAADMQKLGVAGFLSVTPYYNKPSQEGLYQHYRAIAESTPLPIIVYNVPGRTGVNVEVPTIARLAQISNIVGVKEASGNVTQMCEICKAVPADFLVLSGDDALTLPVMAVGAAASFDAIERDPGGDGPDGRSRRAKRLRCRFWLHAHRAANADQLRRSEPIPVRRRWPRWVARRNLSSADGATASGVHERS
jgi:4-hydroxy-tetrahydrodipicolinate synthase